MQKIYIDNLLNKKNFIRNITIEAENELELDFSNVHEIRMRDIEKLIDLQKLAIFNQIKIKIDNLTPDISKILEQTGLYKTLNTFENFEPVKIHKRLGLAMD